MQAAADRDRAEKRQHMRADQRLLMNLPKTSWVWEQWDILKEGGDNARNARLQRYFLEGEENLICPCGRY